MSAAISTENNTSRHINIALLRKVFLLSVMVFLLAHIFFSAFYLLKDYTYLKNWFFSLNDCFYRKDFWDKEFFTPATKASGNRFAVVSVLIGLSGIFYILFRWKTITNREHQLRYTLSRLTVAWYSLVIVMAISLCVWGNSLISPAYDEIFSAFNCAKLHPLQTLIYYMLPNNHIYFNLLNNLIFHGVGDNIPTGRLISGVAYVGVLCVTFYWFSKLWNNRILAFLGVVAIAVQFTTWGFGFQARGYEWNLLCAWISFAALFTYIKTEDARTLRINAIFSIVGFCMVATYLYFFVAQCVFILLIQAYTRRFKFQFWKYQFIVLCVVFLCFEPAISFSGLNAFINNATVKTNNQDLAAYLPNFLSVFKYFINTCFSFLIKEDHPINFIIFLVPLLLLFSRNKERRLYGLFYATLWLVWIAMVLNSKMHPFCRSMIIHYSMTLAFVMYTVYAIADSIATHLKKPFLKSFIFSVPVLLASVHYFRGNAEHVSYNLYFNDVNPLYKAHTDEIKEIPKGSTIGFSEESFYMYYVSWKLHYDGKKCNTAQEDYYIIRPFETMDSLHNERYTQVKEWSELYVLYKRKQSRDN